MTVNLYYKPSNSDSCVFKIRSVHRISRLTRAADAGNAARDVYNMPGTVPTFCSWVV